MSPMVSHSYVDGFVQDCGDSNALVMKLPVLHLAINIKMKKWEMWKTHIFAKIYNDFYVYTYVWTKLLPVFFSFFPCTFQNAYLDVMAWQVFALCTYD